jgi:transcriptional regulator with XRE-family HTH domain
MFDAEDTGVLDVDVGRRVARLRQVIGLTQPAFGEQIGLSQPHVSQIESGLRRLSIETAMLACAQWGVSLDWLYRGDANGLPVRLHKAISAHASAEAGKVKKAKKIQSSDVAD